MSSPLVVLAAVVLAALAASVVLARLVRRRRGRVASVGVAVLTALALVGGGAQAWARASLEKSTLARTMVWFEADVDDLRRFPARDLTAGEALPLRDGELPDGVLDEVAVDGVDTDLDELVDRTQTEALLVLRGQDVVHEQYAHGGGAAALHTSFSVAKSFLSTLVGIAVERGDLPSLDAPLTTWVPELLERDERFGRITLRHLLSMSSGLCYREQGMPWSDDAVTYYSPDLRSTALSAEVCEEPGRTWLYNNYNPLLVGLVLERATGESVADYASEHLWGPMGAEADGSWSLDSDRSGFEKMESGVNAVPRDYARFGLLFAREGRAGGRQVLSREWVSGATAQDTSRDPSERYQLWWWVDTERPGRSYAHGNKGQFVYVEPEHDVVVVRLGREYGGVQWPEVLRDVADRVVAEG